MKKTLASIMVIAMIVMLAACGRKEEPAPSAGTDITQAVDNSKDNEPTKAAEPTTEPTAEPNPTDEPADPTAEPGSADEPADPTAEPSEPDVTLNRSEKEISVLAGIWVNDSSYYIINEDGEMTYYIRQAGEEDTEVRTYRIVLAAGDDPHGFYAQTGDPDDLQTFFSYSPMEENGNADCLLFENGESVFFMASTHTEPMTQDQALWAIIAYSFEKNPELEEKFEEGLYNVSFGVSIKENIINVWNRSYTGSYEYYYIDPVFGDTYVTVFGPLTDFEERMTDETLNAWYYVDRGMELEEDFSNRDTGSDGDSDETSGPDYSDDHATIDAIWGRWMDSMAELGIFLAVGQNGEFSVIYRDDDNEYHGNIEIARTDDDSTPYVYNFILDDGSFWGDLLWDPSDHSPQTEAYSPSLDIYFYRDPEWED